MECRPLVTQTEFTRGNGERGQTLSAAPLLALFKQVTRTKCPGSRVPSASMLNEPLQKRGLEPTSVPTGAAKRANSTGTPEPRLLEARGADCPAAPLPGDAGAPALLSRGDGAPTCRRGLPVRWGADWWTGVRSPLAPVSLVRVGGAAGKAVGGSG